MTEPNEPLPPRFPWLTTALVGCGALAALLVAALVCGSVGTIAALTTLGAHLDALFDEVGRELEEP